MKTSILSLAVAAVMMTGAVSARADWLTDYKAALAKAKASHRNVLMDFSGSDWCEMCIKMDKDVLDTPEFKGYADKNLVLLKVDFPQTHPLPRQLQDQNDQLEKDYAPEGYPEYYLVDKDGKVLGTALGYIPGGPSAFIAKIEGMAKK